ncbi:MAG: hypothetical protein [Circular genetic element sp.]|nr:MAG: hypothetical protein [Circular genetic element sp.]
MAKYPPLRRLSSQPRVTYKRRRVRVVSKKKIDKKQDKRISALERANKAEQGWIDSSYREATMSRTPQLVSRGVQNSATADPEFFVMAQGTDGSDKDHKRIGLSITAKTIRAHITLSGRGDSAGYPPVTGSRSGQNQVRLLGVIYKTLADFNTGLTEVLENPTALNTHPARVIDSFYKKQSSTNWHIWCDKICNVPFTTQYKKIELNYKIPPRFQKMVYAQDLVGAPETNIIVLYAMTGVRDDAQNQLTLQATYRMTYAK